MEITLKKELTRSEFAEIIEYKGIPSRSEMTKHEENCKKVALNSTDDLPIAKHIIANASDISKSIENRRKEVKEPYLRACKMIDSIVKIFVSSLDNEIQEAEKRITLFQEKNDVKRNFRKTWKYRVINIYTIPTEFLTVDNIKINKFISENKEEIEKGATKMIPGIKFYTENSLVL